MKRATISFHLFTYQFIQQRHDEFMSCVKFSHINSPSCPEAKRDKTLNISSSSMKIFDFIRFFLENFIVNIYHECDTHFGIASDKLPALKASRIIHQAIN